MNLRELIYEARLRSDEDTPPDWVTVLYHGSVPTVRRTTARCDRLAANDQSKSKSATAGRAGSPETAEPASRSASDGWTLISTLDAAGDRPEDAAADLAGALRVEILRASRVGGWTCVVRASTALVVGSSDRSVRKPRPTATRRTAGEPPIESADPNRPSDDEVSPPRLMIVLAAHRRSDSRTLGDPTV